MAKVQIKSEKLTPFGGIFSIMEQFDSMLSPVIDSTLGQRCSSIIGYQFSEIVRSMMSVYFCGGSCVEDVTSQSFIHLHPLLNRSAPSLLLKEIAVKAKPVEEASLPDLHAILSNQFDEVTDENGLLIVLLAHRNVTASLANLRKNNRCHPNA